MPGASSRNRYPHRSIRGDRVPRNGGGRRDRRLPYPPPHDRNDLHLRQILAAARDFTPIYYKRYIIDKHNKSPAVQQAAIDNAHYFYSLSPADRRAYSEEMVTNFADPTTASWPNWAKIFFNNKGVAAKETDRCADYPTDDQSVWD
jgi:hypothetical protein